MNEIGLRTYLDNEAFEKNLAPYNNGLKQIEGATDRAASSLTKSGDKIKKSLDLSAASSKLASVTRVLDTAGITQGMGDVASGASMAVTSITGLSAALSTMSGPAIVIVAAIAAVAFAISKIKNAYEGATPAQKALNIELERSAKGYEDAAQGLVELGNVTREQAAAALAYLKDHQEYAKGFKQIQDLVQPTRNALQEIGKAFEGVGETVRKVILMSIGGWASFITLITTGSVEKMNEAALTAMIGAKASAEDIAKSGEKTIEAARLGEQEKGIKQYEAAERAAGKQMLKIDQELAANKEIIAQDSVKGINDINAEVIRGALDIDRSLARQQAQTERQWIRQLEAFARDRAKIESDLANTLGRIDYESNKQLYQNAKDLKKSLARLDKDTAKSLADVDENMQENWRNLRTARARRDARKAAAKQKEDILENAAERRADLEEASKERAIQYAEQKAERIADAHSAAEERRKALAVQMTLAREQVDYQKAQAAEQAAYQKKEARRVADYQIEVAKATANEQIRLANERAKKEKANQLRSLLELQADISYAMKKMGLGAFDSGKSIGGNLMNGMIAGVESKRQEWKDALDFLQIQWAYPTQNSGDGGGGFHSGGPVGRSAKYDLLAGEYVLNRRQTAMLAPLLTNNNNTSYMFSHTWNANASGLDKSAIEQVVEQATYRSLTRVMQGV